MNDVKFPALVGDSPLAILAAIGTLKLICDFVDDHALLSWDAADHVPVLHSSMTSIDDVVARLTEVVEAMPEGVVIPGGPPGFPPPGGTKDRLKVKQGELPKLIAQITENASLPERETLQRWIPGLVTDLATDNQNRGAVSQFIASSGQQKMATMLEKPLDKVRANPDYLRQALVGWRRISGVTGEYLDHRASLEGGEDCPRGNEETQGKAKMRGVPGATWLALMSYPLWTTSATGSHVRTSGWHTVSAEQKELRLPLWSEPLGLAAVKALVEHPALEGDWDDIDQNALRTLGVIHVCRAHRRKAEGGKSAGVLVPLP